jgi:hypothetical protein
MKQKIPGGVAVVVLIIIAVLVVVFGYRKVTGGADADVTDEVVQRYQNMAKQNVKGGTGQMTHGAPPANAPGNNGSNSR